MPYDDITKMRAELLERYGPNERPEEFDDGASLLGQNPYMQEVGIFGKPPKFNPSRRTMGLDLPSVKNPIPTAIEDPITAVVPAQPQQPKTISPLETIANMPMSRRKALEIPMNAAISNVGKGLVGEAVAPVIESVAQVAPKAAQSAFVRNPIFDEYLQNYVSDIFENMPEGAEAGINTYGILRRYLEDKIPEKTLKKYDKLSDEADYEDDDGYLESAIEARNKLETFIFDNLKYLKPNEMQTFIEDITQSDQFITEDFAEEVIDAMENYWGIEDAKGNAEEFTKYLKRARSQK